MSIEKEVTDSGVKLSLHPLPGDKSYLFIQCDIDRQSRGRRPRITFMFPGTFPTIKESEMVLWLGAARNLMDAAKTIADELRETVPEL